MSTLAERFRELVVEADRLERANGDLLCEVAGLEKSNDVLCDDITESKKDIASANDRIRVLEEALRWFADKSHYHGTYRRGAGFVDDVGLRKARAALLGMDEDDSDAVAEAWAKAPPAEAAAE